MPSTDASVGIEWGASVKSDAVIPTEIKETIPYLRNPFSGDFSGEFGLGPYTVDPVCLIEWRQTRAAPARVKGAQSSPTPIVGDIPRGEDRPLPDKGASA